MGLAPHRFVCVNAHGNVMSFIAPAGIEHIRVGAGALSGARLTDGYAVCSGVPFTDEETIHGYDFGDLGKSDWGPPMSSPGRGPAASPSLERRLMAAFGSGTRSAWMPPGDVTVTVRVTNISGSSLAHVDYTRLSDFDAGGSRTNLWTRTVDEVSAINRVNDHGSR